MAILIIIWNQYVKKIVLVSNYQHHPKTSYIIFTITHEMLYLTRCIDNCFHMGLFIWNIHRIKITWYDRKKPQIWTMTFFFTNNLTLYAKFSVHPCWQNRKILTVLWFWKKTKLRDDTLTLYRYFCIESLTYYLLVVTVTQITRFSEN